MFPTLLRRFGLVPRLVLFLLALVAARPAAASHLLGGEMSYKYLDANGPAGTPFRYQITVSSYFNGLYPSNPNVSSPPTSIAIDIFNRTGGNRINTVTASRAAGGIGSPITPRVPSGCSITGPSQPFYLLRYTATVSLPISVDGYYAVYTLSARNTTLTNISNVNNDVPLTLYVSMAPPLIYNRSPVFSDTAVAIVCANDTTVLLNNAVDADGDRLVYSFGTPYADQTNYNSFPPLPALVPYNPGYSTAAPFGPGAGNFAIINASTGTAKYGATKNGLYGVAVDVGEYRTINGREVLIGTTRRDLQLVVATCPPTAAPVLPPVSTTPRSYSIEEGQSLSIPLSATQSAGHSLTMTLNSVLLDGAGGFDTKFNGSTGVVIGTNPTGTATATGNGTVSGTFVYNSVCGEGRATPYDVAFTIKDNGCAGKTVADVIRISVTKPTGRTGLTGDALICSLNTVSTYSATGGTAPTTRWRVVGGTIVGSNTGSSVQVKWATAGSGLVVARGVSSYGCLTDSVSQTVTVAPAGTLTIGGGQSVCQGSSVTLTVTGGTAPYTLSGGGTSQTGAGPFTVTPTQTTTYTISSATATGGCTGTAQVTVTVVPGPAANVGAATRTTCSGTPLTLGAAPVAGNTYSWSPATGLSSATVANPTLTLTNTTNAPITQTYTLTETSATGGCTATNSVTVTINPAAVAVPGNAVTLCSGGSAQLGAAPVSGFTYSWSPATGLSSATVANPTVTLTNTTGATITTTYTLTVTNTATGCVGTATVAVTVNPIVTAAPGAPVAICSGGSAQLGAPPVAGLVYSWSPATGLSSTTVANPTVTLTNTTSAPTTQTYTLTTTNSATGCVSVGTVVVTVNPAVVAVPGAAVTFCSGGSAQLGVAPVTGFTYSWSPATGLSSTTVANPTVTLTNTTGAAITTTYTLTTTSAATGCVGTATVAVTVNPAVVAVPGAAVTFCSGGSAQLGAAPVAGFIYSWSPATGLSSATVANPTVTLTNTTGAPTTTTYTLTVTSTATGCVGTGTVAVTVNPLPVVVAGPAVTTCSGVPVALGGPAVSGFTYSWSPATGLSSPTVANPTVTLTNTTGAAFTQTYTLTVTNGSTTCANSATVAVTVNPAVVAVPGAAVAFCSGGSTQLGAAPVSGFTYSWSPATGLSSATAANPTVTLTNTTNAPTTTTYTLTVTNTATGCVGTGTVAVTVNPLPVVVAGPATTICSGTSAQLGAAPVAGFTYSWSPATGLSSATVANPTVTLTNTTNAPFSTTYTLTVTNAATGCVNTGTVAVTVNPAATAAAGPAQAVCDKSTITLGTAPLPGYSYRWTPATNLSSATVARPVLTGVNTTSAPIIQKYVVLATTALGCVSKDSVLITINPRPVADTIVGPRSVCPTITGIVYSIQNPHSSVYNWTVTGGNLTSGQGTASITVDWPNAGTGSVRVTSTNAQNCVSDGFTLPVISNRILQTAKPTGPGSVCQADGPYSYQTVLANGSSYAWQLFGTAQGTTVNVGNKTTISFTSAGLAKLVVTETSNPSGGQCRGVSDTLYITVKPSPLTTLNIQGPDRFCVNSGAQTYTLAGASGSTYAFQLNGAPIANVGGVVTIPASTAVGTYTLTARETSAGNCAGPLYTKTFTVDPRPGTIVINGPRFVCPAALSLTYTVPNATPGSTYQWTVAGGTITAGQGTATITVAFPANTTTNKTVSVTETSAFGCGGTAVAITVVPDNAQAPLLTLASVLPTDNTKVTLTFSVANPGNTPNPVQVLRRTAGSTGAFTTVGTVPASATTFVDATGNAAQTAYEYSLGLTNGCGDLATAPTSATTVLLNVVAVPGPGGRNQGAANLSWTAYQGFAVAGYRLYRQDDSKGYTLVTTLPAGTLQYSAANAGQGFNQCFRVVAFSSEATPRESNSNTACVDFANKTAFYNIITPNNDGQNDKLEIDNVQLYPGNSMTIFNRWGREVYSTTNYNNTSNAWGTDPAIAAGVYYYLFKLADGTATKGWVEVVK